MFFVNNLIVTPSSIELLKAPEVNLPVNRLCGFGCGLGCRFADRRVGENKKTNKHNHSKKFHLLFSFFQCALFQVSFRNPMLLMTSKKTTKA
jgi:hypothetical protein